jgi:hypothetical protein
MIASIIQGYEYRNIYLSPDILGAISGIAYN